MIQVIDHGSHLTVEDETGANLGATVGHPRFFTRAGADNWARTFQAERDRETLPVRGHGPNGPVHYSRDQL